MALDHALGGKEGLDLLSDINHSTTLPQPVWTLGPEAEALKTEADTGLAAALGGHLLVAFLATDPTGVATRLGADRAFGLGRSGSFCLG